MSEPFPAHPADDLPRAFVVGCKKSGTTWMQALLEVHPQVCSRGEAGFAPLLATPMFEQLKAYNQQQRAGAINTYSGADALTLARFAINSLQRKWIDLLPEPERAQVRVIADKSPEHALSLDVLGAIYPDMKAIHIIRDGRDCVVSGWHYNMRGNAKAFRSQFVSMESYASYFAQQQWVPSVTRAHQWGARHPERYLELRYEWLLDEPREQARRIFAFLGVDASDPVIERVVERTSFKALSGGREPGEVNNRSHFRKGSAAAGARNSTRRACGCSRRSPGTPSRPSATPDPVPSAPDRFFRVSCSGVASADRQTMTGHSHAHPADTLPRAFVVGCQKSGTSWMQALLNAHPEVCAHGEACFGTSLLPRLVGLAEAYNKAQRAGTTNAFDADDTVRIMRLAICILQRKWYEAAESNGSIRVIAEKTPEEALTLDALQRVFPSMRVVHIIRDGRDGVVSGWHHNLREKGDAFRAQFPSMERYAAYFAEHHWVPYITAARRWGREHPEQYHELRYEDVLESPIEHARAIFAFLGVDAGDGPVAQAVERASFRSMSAGRARGQVDNGSHMRKGTSGGWRDDLDQASIDIFEQIGGPMLDTLGYPRAATMST